MKKILFAAIFLLFSFTSVDNIGTNLEEIKKLTSIFSLIDKQLQKDNGKLWNHPLSGAIMFVDRTTRTIYANEPDLEGKFTQYGKIYLSTLPENINIANTAFKWNGKQWTMVALPLPENEIECLNLVIHECFHRIQPEIGFDNIIEKQNTHLDFKNERIYLKLEVEALKKAMQTTDPEYHIKNALLFRQYRYHIQSAAKECENLLEINEGLAEFTGSILSGRTDSALKIHYINKLERLYASSFVRSFAYFTIPMYGYFMYKTDNKWNTKINKNTNLTDFMCSFYKLDKAITDSNKIKEIGKQYSINQIVNDETEREIRIIERNMQYRKMFLTDNVLILPLDDRKIGFDPSRINTFDTLGTVFPIMRAVDNWGILEVDSCGVLMNKNWTVITATCPQHITDSVITGYGWKLRLNNSWKLEKKDKTYTISKK